MKEIHIKDLKKGDFLINHGTVHEVEEYGNSYRIVVSSHLGYGLADVVSRKSISVHIRA
jgi:hypothetical protein